MHKEINQTLRKLCYGNSCKQAKVPRILLNKLPNNFCITIFDSGTNTANNISFVFVPFVLTNIIKYDST